MIFHKKKNTICFFIYFSFPGLRHPTQEDVPWPRYVMPHVCPMMVVDVAYIPQRVVFRQISRNAQRGCRVPALGMELDDGDYSGHSRPWRVCRSYNMYSCGEDAVQIPDHIEYVDHRVTTVTEYIDGSCETRYTKVGQLPVRDIKYSRPYIHTNLNLTSTRAQSAECRIQSLDR